MYVSSSSSSSSSIHPSIPLSLSLHQMFVNLVWCCRFAFVCVCVCEESSISPFHSLTLPPSIQSVVLSIINWPGVADSHLCVCDIREPVRCEDNSDVLSEL